MLVNTKTVYLQWHNIPFKLIEFMLPVSQLIGHTTTSCSAGVLLSNDVLWHGDIQLARDTNALSRDEEFGGGGGGKKDAQYIQSIY